MKKTVVLLLSLSLLTGCMGSKLMKAVQNGDIQSVRKLIEKGEDINQLFSNRDTPLIVAASNGNLGMVRELIE